MKDHLAQKHSTVHRLAFTLLAATLSFTLAGYSPPTQSYDDGSTAICYVIFIPLWILSIWYWYRHYKIRGQSATLAMIVAFIFNGLAVLAMIIDAPLRAIFSKQEFGPCPNCGKTKLIRENPSQAEHVAQPQCPHCKTFVGPTMAPVAAVRATASVSISKQIEELQGLLDKNLITKEEFEKKKTELLNRM
jgi:predicted RNA-binding Zn-ribbon protein involved in translation (DUF1610 family)